MHQFVYFGDRSKHKTNVITVAYILHCNHIQFEFVCSRNDDIYDKEEGKSLAFERLARDPIQITFTNNVYSTIANHMLEMRQQSLPSWGRKMLRKYLTV
jgi:hypothetical protein